VASWDGMNPKVREPRLPPAVIGGLLLLVVVMAVTFYVAAQIIQTP
jgi:hypothetical protein